MAMGNNAERPQLNLNLLNMKLLKFCTIVLLFSSCLGQNNGENKTIIDNGKNKLEITCFMVSLDGEKKIYQIKNDTIFWFGSKEQINKNMYHRLKDFPKGILEKDNQIGCGTCLDEVDYKFILKINGEKSTWLIQPGQEIPQEYKPYFQLLIGYYEQAITKK